MTSQAQAASPFPGVRGLVFLGFPLHPAGRPSDERGKHLFEVKIPMLFLQGTRDDLANQQLLKALCERIGGCAALKLFQDADHSFHVPARTGRKDAEVRVELLDALADWIHVAISGNRVQTARELAWCTQPNGVLRSVTGRGLDSRDGAYDVPRDLAVPPCSQHFDIRVITRPLKLCFERASI